MARKAQAMAATQTTTTRSSTKAKLSSKPTILQILNDIDANEDKDNNKQIHAHDGDDDATDTTSTNTKQTQAKQEKDKNKKKKKKNKDEEEEEAAEAKLVLVPGTRVATADAQGLPLNTYEIGDELGRGTASRVYRATNVATGVVYAIKVTLTAPLHAKLRELPFLSSSASSSSSSSTAAALLFRHAHLVQVLEIARLVGGGARAGAWLSVMELLRGGPDLRASVRVPMPEVRARALFRQLVSALAFLHNRGVAHSALKPSNVLLHPRGGLRLADFAGNRRNPPPPPPPPYGAPEAIRAKRDDGGYWYDAAKADVYSAGVLLYEMVAGRPPPAQPFAFPSYFSAPLRRLLCGMLEPDPRSRMSLNAVMTSPWLAQLPPYPCVGDANSRKKDRAPVVVPHRQRRSFQSLLSCFGLSLD